MLKNEAQRKDLINLLKCRFQGLSMIASRTKKQYHSLDGFDETRISVDGKNWKPFPARKDCMTPAQASQSIEQTIQNMVSQVAQSGCRALDLKAGAFSAFAIAARILAVPRSVL